MHTASPGIGDLLRQRREARGLSLSDAERRTKIRAAYLRALEEERFDALPAQVYARGFLRAYARLLGLDAEAVVAAFERQVPPAPPPGLAWAPEVPLEPAATPSRARRLFRYGIGIGVVLLLLAGYGLYAQIRVFVRSQPAPIAAPPVPTSAPAEVGVEAPSEPDAPVSVAASPQPREEGVTMILTATGTSWIRVVADGRRVFQGFVYAGDRKSWDATRRLEIRVGNAAVVELTVNGRNLGPLGRPGQVVTRSFSADRSSPPAPVRAR